MDVCARALLAAAAMIEDGSLARHLEQRYASWDGEEGQAVLDGARSLDELAARVERLGREPQPVSGRQEYLENLVNRFV
jgi:xylose isomerase